ncbi:hypothetical protein BGX23_009956 [Mortierella sp. AD031]|nr:hypothetical protein BGX23_009956 [Mortierella sp. AD031]KAG0214529.1 hypothetical protein BGX33_002071 [Mortierella sp. NVP41]
MPWRNSSPWIPDLVCKVNIVDADGTLNTFTREKDPVGFSAATFNLGLPGIIYSYTVRVESMFNLITSDTYPLRDSYFGYPKLGGARLKEKVRGNDQTMILYWPFNNHFGQKGQGQVQEKGSEKVVDEIWVKQWQWTDLPQTKAAAWKAFQRIRQHISSICGDTMFGLMSAYPRLTPLVNHIISKKFRSKNEMVLAAPDATYYRAISMLPHILGYAKRGEFPVNVTIDMRFIKSSDLLMSYAYDEDSETIYCTIEVLSAANTKGFEEFPAVVAQHCMQEFQAKPHRAKLWEHIPGVVPYLRDQAGP